MRGRLLLLSALGFVVVLASHSSGDIPHPEAALPDEPAIVARRRPAHSSSTRATAASMSPLRDSSWGARIGRGALASRNTASAPRSSDSG